MLKPSQDVARKLTAGHKQYDIWFNAYGLEMSGWESFCSTLMLAPIYYLLDTIY